MKGSRLSGLPVNLERRYVARPARFQTKNNGLVMGPCNVVPHLFASTPEICNDLSLRNPFEITTEPELSGPESGLQPIFLNEASSAAHHTPRATSDMKLQSRGDQTAEPTSQNRGDPTVEPTQRHTLQPRRPQACD